MRPKCDARRPGREETGGRDSVLSPKTPSRTMKSAVLLLAVAGLVAPAAAQEFNCSVTVNYQNLTGSDYTYLDELRQKIGEYMNERRWTEDRFEEAERIDCTMQVLISEAISMTSFRARLIVATRRPIYGTAQQSTVIQFNDEDWAFEFAQGTPLVFDLSRFQPLTSVLNFYAYLMLGFDFDTFSPSGGTPFFEQARRISDMAQASGAAGWTALSGDRSRSELIKQILDPRFRNLRRAYFDYHFGCLDRFVEQTDGARETLMEVITALQVLSNEVSRSYYLDQFFSTKYQEIAAVFQGSRLASQAFDILSVVDPSHLSDYNQMMQ